MRAILGGQRGAAFAPGEGVVLVAAETGAALDADDEGGEARLPSDRLRQLLVAGDAQFGPRAARVGAGEEGAVADVPAGVSQLQTRDHREVAAQSFEGLED